MSFIESTFLLVLLYATCGIVAGSLQRWLGLLSVGHAGVLGSGAYAYALAVKSGLTPLFGAAIALGVGALAGSGLAVLAVRVREERYSLTTFGIQIIWLGLANNLNNVTGGALGIPGIPTPGGMGILLMFAAVLVALAGYSYRLFAGTALGAGCEVFSRSKELAATLGIRYITILLSLGTLYGGLVGLSGSILAGYLGFIDPTLFALGVSVTILAIAFFVVVNGILGGLLGSILLIGVPQVVRLLGISTASAGYVQLMLSGLALTAATVLWVKRNSRESIQ